MIQRTRRRLRARGIVQGVGLRPAVHRAATERGLSGFVGNDGDGVFAEVEGHPAVVDEFVASFRGLVPPLAVVDGIEVATIAAVGGDRFRIVDSVAGGPVSTSVPPDIAPCDDCLAELTDPDDRRHRYPFVNCTNCGPRYSIIRELPYDRSNTTMAAFEMCDPCRREYEDPGDRRYHAQPTCCPVCGPVCTLRDADFAPVDTTDVIESTAASLRDGAILAIKGLGGYHLAVDASNADAVRRLRARKHREEKPLALLVADVDAASRLVHVATHEADLLRSPERPIVLLRRRRAAPVADEVAPGNRALGLLLPPTPLHVLLAEAFGGPLVLTSANRSAQPIIHEDELAASQLREVVDGHLTHDRPIHTRIDDSVTRVVGARQIVVRRARGFAPRPVRVPVAFARHTLACGAALKSTVCVGRDDRAVVSQHLGDLENHETREVFEQTIVHLCELFDVHPEVVAHDLHPDLASTSHARERVDAEPVAIQHHHAHIAACLVDNRHEGPVIGVAFDGTGFGPDGTVWGGEILHADLRESERVGRLAPVPLPGGDAAVREPWRMAVAHLAAAVDPDIARSLDVHAQNAERWPAIESMIATGVRAPLTSSMGRLFDAVAAIVGVRHRVSYEGQAAIELEQRASQSGIPYPVTVEEGEVLSLDPRPLIRGVVDDVRVGVDAGQIAARFHASVVELVVRSAVLARDRTGTRTVALSGGVFQNVRLVESVVPALVGAGFDVLTHRRFPPNDGGISLGQAAIVAARDRSR